jgi:hypothetical protein
MSKRMSLIEAAARKRDEFVKAPAVSESPPWTTQGVEEVVVPPPTPPTSIPVTRQQLPPADETPRKKTTFNIDARLHRKLKLTAVRQEREMVEIVEEALAHHLKTIERGVGE